ncbi:hypothetical protein Zmor_020475 [Zophobas morio]|uniref:Pacifastin domain-containing protein n=1 Tax=Zophobas morio TaxID=2755281 RepID=A0AA38I3S9_9CUCU|nr:hypothetical protein Zmor_020475 [Zophobas morio]
MNSVSSKWIAFLIVFIFCFVNFGDATICKPLSKFKIDCNVCECSRDGRQYSCTEKRCLSEVLSSSFDQIDEDSYVLVKSKQDVKSAAEDFVLTRKNRQIPYRDDHIFRSNENEDN